MCTARLRDRSGRDIPRLPRQQPRVKLRQSVHLQLSPKVDEHSHQTSWRRLPNVFQRSVRDASWTVFLTHCWGWKYTAVWARRSAKDWQRSHSTYGIKWTEDHLPCLQGLPCQWGSARERYVATLCLCVLLGCFIKWTRLSEEHWSSKLWKTEKSIDIKLFMIIFHVTLFLFLINYWGLDQWSHFIHITMFLYSISLFFIHITVSSLNFYEPASWKFSFLNEYSLFSRSGGCCAWARLG